MAPEDPLDDDHLDGCDIPAEDIEDEETADLRLLFPAGLDTPDLERTAAEIRELGALDA